MELLQLKYFKAVAEAGKVVAAAEKLYISPPALSMSILRLEKELGMPLFDRANNRITLNKQGKIFLRYVNQVLTSLECAQAELRQSLLQQEKHVPIAVTTSNLWIELITAFSQEYAHFTLSSTTLNMSPLMEHGLQPQYAFLLAEEGDVPPAHGEKLESIVLFEDQPAVMVHPSHPLAKEKEVDIHALLEEKLLLPLREQSLYARLVDLFEANGVTMPNAHAYSYFVCRSMVAENLGVSFTTMHASRMEPNQLCYVPIVSRHRPWRMRLYWHANREMNEDNQIFKEFVEEFYHVTENQGA